MKILNDTGNFDLFFGLRFVVLLFEKSTYKLRFAFSRNFM